MTATSGFWARIRAVEFPLHTSSRGEKIAYLLISLMLVTVYLNIGYVMANDVSQLCQNMTASSVFAEDFWMKNEAISPFCPATSRPLNTFEFSAIEVGWPLAYAYGGLHWFAFFVFQGGVAKMLLIVQ